MSDVEGGGVVNAVVPHRHRGRGVGVPLHVCPHCSTAFPSFPVLFPHTQSHMREEGVSGCLPPGLHPLPSHGAGLLRDFTPCPSPRGGVSVGTTSPEGKEREVEREG